jgi:PAS domain S-box-containing protein
VQELQARQHELERQYEELRHLQAEAERTRAQFIDLYEFAPVGYCTLAANGTLLQLNQRTSQLLGQACEQLLGQRLVSFVLPAERPRFAEFLGRLWATPGQRQSCELALRGPHNERFYAQLEGTVTPEGTADGQPPGCRLVLLDVTARRRATDQLAAREARFRATFEQARDGMLLLDDGYLVDINAAGLRLLGSPDRSEVLGLPLASFWPRFQPDGRRSAEVLAHCLHAAQAHGWGRLEWRRYGPTGEEIWDELSFNPVVVEGQPMLHASWRDSTARRQTEQALGYKNRLLDTILHNLPVLLARIGPDGRCREHVGQVLGRLGLAPNELVGRQASEVFPRSAAYFDRLLAGERHSYVATATSRGGQPIYLQCFGFYDEAQQEVVVFALDITEPEQLKEEATRLRLRQQQEVLSAILSTQEEERRRIAEGLHNGVGQLLYGTRLHLDALPTSEAVRASRLLLNEAIEATRGISFELTPSILEDFGLEVALRELVSRIPTRLAVDLNLHGLAEPLPALLTTAIYRVVQELLNNVMKHAQAQEVFVQIAREDDQLYLSVEDDGVGFDAQAEAGRGGIGLAGIRTRVGLLGGTISSNSRPGRGTGFFLHVPVPAG